MKIFGTSLFALLFALLTFTACSAENTGAAPEVSEATEAPVIHVPDSQELGAGAITSCIPRNCATAPQNRCGPLSNGCGGTIVCSACINGRECVNGECVVPASVILCNECARTGGHCVTLNNVLTCQH